MNNNKITEISDKILGLCELKLLNLEKNKLTYLANISQIRETFVKENSFDNFDKLSVNYEYLQISHLTKPLKNLPTSIKEVRLYDPMCIDVKIPFGCKLYINNELYLQDDI